MLHSGPRRAVGRCRVRSLSLAIMSSSSSFRKRVYCCVYGCLNNTGTNPELSFFQIPKDPEKEVTFLSVSIHLNHNEM
jgi:hypothetical protein